MASHILVPEFFAWRWQLSLCSHFINQGASHVAMPNFKEDGELEPTLY